MLSIHGELILNLESTIKGVESMVKRDEIVAKMKGYSNERNFGSLETLYMWSCMDASRESITVRERRFQ